MSEEPHWKDKLLLHRTWNRVCWVYPEGLSVYLRISRRVLPGFSNGEGVLFNTLDIATVDATAPGNGAFSRWLPEVERLAMDLDLVVYVENVLNDRLLRHLVDKRGYSTLDVPWPDYGRYLAKKVTEENISK